MTEKHRFCRDRILPKDLARPQGVRHREGRAEAIIILRKLWINGSTAEKCRRGAGPVPPAWCGTKVRDAQVRPPESYIPGSAPPAPSRHLGRRNLMLRLQRSAISLTVALGALCQTSVAPPASAHSTGAAHSKAEKQLAAAFNTYCSAVLPEPDVCKKGASGEWVASRDRQYLALEVACRQGDIECSHCKEFQAALSEREGGETLAPLVLALDHRTGRWRSANRLAQLDKARVRMDVAGEPTVSLTGGERLVVVVENTNPLLYGAAAGKPTEVDAPELASIQELLKLAGGNIASYLKVLGEPSTREALGSAREVYIASMRRHGKLVVDNRPIELEAYIEALKRSGKDLEDRLLEVQCRVGQTTAQTSRAVAFIQDLELGKGSDYLLSPPTPPRCGTISRLDFSIVSEAFAQLEKYLFSPGDRLEDCGSLLSAASAVLVADPVVPSKVSEALAQYDRTALAPGHCLSLANLKEETDLLLKDVRSALDEARQATEDMRAHADYLAELEKVDKPTPKQEALLAELRAEKMLAKENERIALDKLRQELRTKAANAPFLSAAAAQGAALAAVRKAAGEILAKRDDAQKAATQVQVFEERLNRYRVHSETTCPTSSDSEPCVPSTSLDLRIIIEPQLKAVRQTKIQKHSVTLKPDSSYSTKIVATRPLEVRAEYSLDSVLRGLWGISASAIYTPLSSPTFGAVTDDGDPEKKVLAVTDESTRAGGVALLADFRLARWLFCRGAEAECGPTANWFGVELGVAVSDDPAFFGGISMRPSRSWRIGFGYTYQQVEALQRDQVLGQEIASADDIRLRDTFEGDWYISLSFALDSLSLFSSGN